MNETDLSRIQPHKTGLFAGYFLGGAAVVFGVIALGIMLSGNTSFEVVEYGLGIESRYVRVLMLPIVAFVGGYAFAFTVCTAIRLIAGWHERGS
ncbi:MAG: hypothetical protein QNJ40_16420 [Xanthomonadales bacterium]|nr:hypothetical protein [Xanthomonadales bacterium]